MSKRFKAMAKRYMTQTPLALKYLEVVCVAYEISFGEPKGDFSF